MSNSQSPFKLTIELEKLKKQLQKAIEENEKLKHNLEESEKKAHTLLQAIPDMIFVVDANGTYLEFYPGTNLEPYVKPCDFLGREIKDVLPDEIAQKSMQFIKKAIDTNEIQFFEFQLQEMEVLHNFECRFMNQRNGKVLAIVRNINERKIFEEILKKSEKNIEVL